MAEHADDAAGRKLADHVAEMNRMERGNRIWFVAGEAPRRHVSLRDSDRRE